MTGQPVPNPETIASAIRIGNPASWQSAVAARDESGGFIESVTDEEILSAYRLLATKEGVLSPPALPGWPDCSSEPMLSRPGRRLSAR